MLLFKLIILFLCFVLIILLMKVTTNRNYRHSNHHSRCLHTHHDRNNHYCGLKIINRIVPYLFLLMFNFCCKGMIRLCSLSAQSKECAKMKEKKQKELILPALIICLTYYNCLNVSTKNASFAFIFLQKSA